MRRLGWIAVAAVLVATPAAAAAAAAPAKVLTLTDSGKTVHLVAGQALRVNLQACPGCGFHWVTAKVPDPHVLLRLPTVQHGGCKAPCTGGNVTKSFRYSARRAGITSLRLEYLPPGSKKPAKTFRLTVRVT